MDKKFYDRSNFTALLQVLNETLESKYSVSFNQISSNKQLFKIMNHIYKRYEGRINSVTELNKRTIDVALPLLTTVVNKKNKAVQQSLTDPKPMQQNINNYQGGIDTSILQNNDINEYASALPMPVAQGVLKSEVDLDKEIERRKNMRRDEFNGMPPVGSNPPQQIDFTKPLQMEQAPSMESSEMLYQQALAKRDLVPSINYSKRESSDLLPHQMREEISRKEAEHSQQFMMNQMVVDGRDEQINNKSTLISDLEQDDSRSMFRESGDMSDRNRSYIHLEQSNNPQDLFKMSSEEEMLNNEIDTFQKVPFNRDQDENGVSSVLSLLEQKLEQLNKTMSENYKYPPEVIKPTKMATKEKIHYITIDSRDRDLEVYPNVNKFQVKFGPASSSKVKGVYRDKNKNLIYEANNIEVFGESGATIPNVLKNVRSIECVQVIVPHSYSRVVGGSPYYYNGYQVDHNLTSVSSDASVGQFTSYPFGPINQVESGSYDIIGAPTNVLDEPYLLLCIDELDQTYNGTNTSNRNAFAKLVHDNYYGTLTAFVQMRTSETSPFMYEPFPLAKIDKLTLRLLKCNNLPYDFGRDKLYIKSYSEGSACVGICGEKSKTTRVTIISNRAMYTDTDTEDHVIHYNSSDSGDCGEANTGIQHCLKPGNKVYFFDTFPCGSEIIKLHQNVKVLDVEPLDITYTGSGTDQAYIITATVDTSDNPDDPIVYVDFSTFLNTGDYLFINNIPYVVTDFETGSTSSVTVSIIYSGQTAPDITNLSSLQLSFAKKNLKGIKSNDKRSLNYIDGWRVSSAYNTTTSDSINPRYTFEIDYPYSWLPERLKNGSVLGETHYETFLIKHQLQVSYTFKVKTVDADFSKLESTIV
jgi:hypothetical protein